MSFNPCGMVMDWLRSCYSTACRFDPSTEATSTIKWYWAPEDAQVFPYRHVFGSSIWQEPDPPAGELGEDPAAPKVYSKGETSPNAHGDGLFCGEASDFLEGAPYLEVAQPVDDFGIPACCHPCPEIDVAYGTGLRGSWPTYTIDAEGPFGPNNYYFIYFTVQGVYDPFPFPVPCGPERKVTAASGGPPGGINPGGSRMYYFLRDDTSDGPVGGDLAGWLNQCARHFGIIWTNPYSLTITLGEC